FVIEIGDRDSLAAGVLEIADIYAHSGASFAVGAEGDSRLDAHVPERPIALIAIKLVGLSVVGDQEVGPAVLVVIEHGHTQRFRAAVKNPGRCCDIFKSAIPPIMKQPAGLPDVCLRRTVGLPLSIQAAEYIVLTRPLDVVADEKIQQSVTVV